MNNKTWIKYAYFALFSILLSCGSTDSPTSSNEPTSSDHESTPVSNESAPSSNETIDITHPKGIEDYFLLSPTKDLSLAQKQAMLQSYKNGEKKNIVTDNGWEAQIKKIDTPNGYLFYYLSNSNGEGGGELFRNSLYYFKDKGNSKNNLLATVSTVGNANMGIYSSIFFYKFMEQKLTKVEVDLPSFIKKDFYPNCPEETKFRDYSYNLPENGENNITLTANRNDAAESDCQSDTRALKLEWTGTGFTKTQPTNTNNKLVCKTEGDVTSCSYSIYRTVLTRFEDEKGRGDSEVFLQKKISGTYKTIKPNQLFQDNPALLDRLSAGVQNAYKELKSRYPEEGDDCMAEINLKESYQVSDFSVSFYEKGIYFGIDFGLSSACFALDGNGFIIPWNEVDPFLRK